MTIIVEGPDGGGKTTLVKALSKELKLPIHSRHCTSEGGPLEGLFDWAHADVALSSFQRASIYDRHPYVSEYIYGNLLRGGVSEEFLSETAHQDLGVMADNYLVIFSIPTLETLQANIQTTPQMEGVESNVEALYWAYREAYAHWPGHKIFYDYEITPLKDVVYQAKSFLVGKGK